MKDTKNTIEETVEKIKENVRENKLSCILMIGFVLLFYIWIKSILGNYEITLYSYFLSGDIDWYGYRWIDVHCFSIIDHWWHYSIGDVTFIIDQEEKTNGI